MMYILIFFILSFLTIEFLLQLITRYFRKDFQWLVIEKDEYPAFNKTAFDNFLDNTFDRELGWKKKPNTFGKEKGRHGEIIYSIDEDGSRKNNSILDTKIATFGDSYTFCRQVEDAQTWQVHLSKKLEAKVLNYGVGNYGVDQALLHYQQQKLPNSIKTVILGFVPETICRVQSYWKHYLEFGNIFAFKPRYTFDNGNLKLHNNLLNSKEDFYNLKNVIQKARKNDEFYEKKFRKLQFRFPYLLSFFRNFDRNSKLFLFLVKKKFLEIFNFETDETDNLLFSVIMSDNIKHSHAMYSDKKACDLLEAILLQFCNIAHERGQKPLLLVMPQLIDLKMIKKQRNNPYQAFYSKISKKVPLIDITEYLEGEDIEGFYTEDLYGGHFSHIGNKFVAEKVSSFIKK